MASDTAIQNSETTRLMRSFLKKIVNNDKRAKQLFKLYFDRNEISQEQFYKAISKI